MGPIAAHALSQFGQGQVIAVFERCFYCEINGDFICVGSASLGMCPLNVATTIPDGGIRSLFGLNIGMSVRVADGCVRIGTGHFLLTFDDVRIWTPDRVAMQSQERLKSGLEALETATARRLPEDGLGKFIHRTRGWNSTTHKSSVLNHAVEPLDRLQAWLRGALANPLNIKNPDILSWQELLGLGPGLTPSGDDLVGGIMLGLHSMGELSLLKVLSSAVAKVLPDRTNLISAAHLRGAMEGMGSEVAHAAIGAILSGNRERISQVITGIEKYGHTSGWDMLAGIVIVFRLRLESTVACQPAA